MSAISGSLQEVGLDVSNVIDWTHRSRREKKPPSLSYWQQYVETDDWYLKKLLEDVPDDEMHAACFEEADLHLDAEEEEEEEDEESASEGESSEDHEFVPEADSSEHDEISSDTSEEWEDEFETSGTNDGTGNSSTEEDEEVLGSTEGK